MHKFACIGTWHPAPWPSPWLRLGGKVIITALWLTRRSRGLSHQRWQTDQEQCFHWLRYVWQEDQSSGDFVHYGEVTSDFVMLKGDVLGSKKHLLTFCESLLVQTKQRALEKTILRFIDNTSKIGHGWLQTVEDKKVLMELFEKDQIAKDERA